MTGPDHIHTPIVQQTDRKIRLLILNLYTEMGGGEHALASILGGFDRSHIVPIMLFPHDGAFPRKTEEMGVETVIVSYPVVMVKRLVVPSVFLETLRASLRINRLIREKKVDLIQCSDLLALLLLTLPLIMRRIPVVYSVIFFYEWTRMLVFNLLALAFVDVIVTNSEAVADDLRANTMMLSGRIETILPGVDTSRFRPADPGEVNLLKRELQIDPSVPLVGMVGRFDPAKGHQMFVRTAAVLHQSLPDLHFVIIGGLMNRTVYPGIDAYYRSVQREASRLSADRCLAFLPYRDDLPVLLRGMDVVVCPSANEGFGLIVLEALASGVPVVLSRSVGAWRTVKDLPGVHTAGEPTDTGFASEVRAALREPDSWQTGVRAALSRDCHWKLSTQRFGVLYSSLVSPQVSYHHYSQWSTLL